MRWVLSPRIVHTACCTPEQLTGPGTWLWERALIPLVASTVDFLGYGTTLWIAGLGVVICYLFNCFFSCSEVWTTSYLLLLLILIIGSICLIIIQLWGFKVWGSIDHLFERSKRCKNENFILGMCVVDQANEKLRPNLKKKKKEDVPNCLVHVYSASSLPRVLKG